jgi:hypothetical protein
MRTIKEEEWAAVVNEQLEQLDSAMRETVSPNSIEYAIYLDNGELGEDAVEATETHFNNKYGKDNWEY